MEKAELRGSLVRLHLRFVRVGLAICFGFLGKCFFKIHFDSCLMYQDTVSGSKSV